MMLMFSLAGQSHGQNGRGWLWVAEQGTGNQDSRVVVVTTDGQVHPFLSGLPSELNATNEVTGATHPYFNAAGELWLLQGEGTDSLSQSILVVDTTGFTPGQTPLGRDAIKAVHKLGDFVLSQPGVSESNPFTMAFGPNDDQYIVDAAANAIIRRDNATGDLSVFASFPALQNPTPVGPPFIDVVPTGIVFTGDRFYVGALTGFPFVDSLARVYEVDLAGNVALFKEGLTTVTDIA
ncbi:ScyD/ScyE family protein, partial [candidate division KSB1 bacterium]|nr:ScyD/ScyE family protein [candidate division KSB1 bacterium]